MFGKAHWALATLGAGLLLGAGPAAATTITSTTFNGWKANLTGTPTELDFTPITPGKSYSTSAGITLKAIGNSSIGFVFTGPDNGSYNLSGFSYTSQNIQSLKAGSDSTAVLNVATPAAGNNAISWVWRPRITPPLLSRFQMVSPSRLSLRRFSECQFRIRLHGLL
jgi:hypothetical protein